MSDEDQNMDLEDSDQDFDDFDYYNTGNLK